MILLYLTQSYFLFSSFLSVIKSIRTSTDKGNSGKKSDNTRAKTQRLTATE